MVILAKEISYISIRPNSTCLSESNLVTFSPMADPEAAHPHPEKQVKAPSFIKRAKEEIEATFNHKSSPRNDTDENTPIAEVKGPNVFERVKEEFEAIFHNVKSPKEARGMGNDDIDKSAPTNEVKAPNVFDRVKEEVEAVFHHKKSPRHHKETHGTSDDISEDTPIEEVKGPNVFERVKEEVEAIVEAIHHKKDSKTPK